MTFDLWDEQTIKLSFAESSNNQKLPRVVRTQLLSHWPCCIC